jgi:hypothetical protein
VGECWAIHAGRAAHLHILQAPTAAEGAAAAVQGAEAPAWVDVRRLQEAYAPGAQRARLQLAVNAAVREGDQPKAAELRRVLAELPTGESRSPLELAPPGPARPGRLPNPREWWPLLVLLIRRVLTGAREGSRP